MSDIALSAAAASINRPEEVADQTQFFQSLWSGVNYGLFRLDVLDNGEAFRYVDFNPALAQTSPIPVTSLIGKTIDEALPVEMAKLYRQRYRDCVQSGQPVSFEEHFCHAGRKTWWLLTVTPLRNHQGQIHQLLVTTTDISKRAQLETKYKDTEVALRKSVEHQTLLNQLSSQIRNSLDIDMVIANTLSSIRDLLDIDNCAFAWYTPDAPLPVWEVVQEAKRDNTQSILKDFPADIVGPIDYLFSHDQILRIDDVNSYEEPIHRRFLQQVGCQSEVVLSMQTSSNNMGIILCTHYQQPRPWADSEVDLLKAVRDQLTIAMDQAELYAQSRAHSRTLYQTLKALKQTQAQMVQNEKMSSLGQMVAGIAHEINNPVNFIHGNLRHANSDTQDLLALVELYQQTYPDPTPAIATKLDDIDLDFLRDDLPKLMASMKVGTERIREIVKSLRIFSRLDEADVKPVDIHDGIDSTLMILQNRLKAKEDRSVIEVVKTYGDLPLIECYAGQLNQVFMNILVNAIDAIEENIGALTTAAKIEVRTELGDEGWVRVAIANNGPSIPESVKSRIFDPFFTTKAVGKGTGMGMSISYQIVTEKHGGRLVCNALPEEGTEFVIEIPIEQPEAMAD